MSLWQSAHQFDASASSRWKLRGRKNKILKKKKKKEKKTFLNACDPEKSKTKNIFTSQNRNSFLSYERVMSRKF